MRSSVGSFRKKMNRRKKLGAVVSLDQRYGGMTAAEKLAAPSDWMDRLEKRMLLAGCAGRLTKEQREILVLKWKGYHMKEIAELQKRTYSHIRKDVKQIREALRPLQDAA